MSHPGGGITVESAVIAILLTTAASIVVKAGLTAASPNRSFAQQTAIWSGVLLAIAAVATGVATL